MANFEFMINEGNKIYEVLDEDISKAESRMGIRLPNDLRQLYSEVGYGFLKGQSESAINRILGPGTVADIRLREGVFESDPDLDIYEDEDMLIFFEVNEGVYLSVHLQVVHTPVYYFDTQIADSLEDFFTKFIADNEYFVDLVE